MSNSVVVMKNLSNRGPRPRVCYEVCVAGPRGAVLKVLLRTAWILGREEHEPSRKIASIAAQALDARVAELG